MTSRGYIIHPRLMGQLSRLVEGGGEQVGTLPDRCSIRRVPLISDGQGGWIPDPDGVSDIYTSVPCRLESAGGFKEGEVGERLQAITYWRITLPRGTDVTPKDQIVVTSQTPNRIFEVNTLPEPQSYDAQMAANATEML